MTLVTALLALLGTIAGIVAVWYNRRNDAATQLDSAIAQAKRELSAALATKRFTDAAFWARRLQILGEQPAAPKEPTP